MYEQLQNGKDRGLAFQVISEKKVNKTTELFSLQHFYKDCLKNKSSIVKNIRPRDLNWPKISAHGDRNVG